MKPVRIPRKVALELRAFVDGESRAGHERLLAALDEALKDAKPGRGVKAALPLNPSRTKDSPEVPVVPELHQAMEAVTRDRAALDMSQWHSCATTHCRAGWAITLAGEAGKRLEEKVGSFLAGCLIYDKSTGYVPHFFASTETARADIERCASLPMGVRG